MRVSTAAVRIAAEPVDPRRPGPRSTAHERLGPAVHVMLGLGLRRAEVLAIRWADIDLDADPPALSVTRQLVYVPGRGLTFGPTKTSAALDLALPCFVADELRALRIRQASRRLQLGELWEDHDLVFTTDRGRPINPRNFGRFLADVVAASGIDAHVHPHKLRHTAASLAIEAGVPIEVITKMLGHRKLGTTSDIYGHLTRTTRDAVAVAMDGVLGRDAAANGPAEAKPTGTTTDL